MMNIPGSNYKIHINSPNATSDRQPLNPINGYNFSVDWFSEVEKIWDMVLPQIDPSTILEIGSFEGRSTVYLIERLASKRKIELHCVDNWVGGIENQATGHAPADMQSVEKRFLSNIKIAADRVRGNLDLHVHKGNSDVELPKLLASGKRNYFDFIYVDGSHQAPDVLFDAVLSFRMLKVGGVIGFDDYLWAEMLSNGVNPLRCPKPAIDAFINIHIHKLEVSSRVPAIQLYARKLSD